MRPQHKYVCERDCARFTVTSEGWVDYEPLQASSMANAKQSAHISSSRDCDTLTAQLATRVNLCTWPQDRHVILPYEWYRYYELSGILCYKM